MANYQLPVGEEFKVPQDKMLIGNLLFPRQAKPFQTDAKITPSQYSLIQDGNKVIAISTSQFYNGRNFDELSQDAIKDGVIIATPRSHLINWQNVNSALRGETPRYNASGRLLETSQVDGEAGVVNHAWVYLNARFPQGSGFRGLDLVTITLQNGKPIFTRVPLQPCLEENCLADVDSMNEQGLLTRKAKTNKYEPGKTVNFYPPILRQDKPEEGLVARFSADSGWAGFYCNWGPASRNESLGGFTSAEGASVAENGARK